MKKLFLFFLVLAISCNKDQVVPVKGSLTFSMLQVSRELSGGRMSATATPAFALLSIEDNNGKVVVQNKKLSLFSFGQGWESESIELLEGNYKLTQFQILNANDTVIYATPMEGSDLAQYVTDALPISFTVMKNESTQVVPQVLEVTSNDTPENFGYVSFGFEVVELTEIRMPISQLADKPDSMVVIITNGNEKLIKQFVIKDEYANVYVKPLSGVSELDLRVFVKSNGNNNSWYGGPLWQIPAEQDNAITSRLSSRLSLTTQMTNGVTLNVSPYLDKTVWKDYFFNSLKQGIGLFFAQDPWTIFLEVDVPDALTINYLHVDKDIYWVDKQGAGYVDQGLTNWDYCNTNSCSTPLTGKNNYKFSIPKTNVLNEVSCHETMVYITCDQGKATEFTDYKEMTFCTVNN